MALGSGQLSDEGRKVLLDHMNRLLSTREYPKTICPSEVARACQSHELALIGVSTWRDLMPIVRELAFERRTPETGDVDVLQGGQVLDDGISLEEIRGPIRLRSRA
jgi:hypothetical protein